MSMNENSGRKKFPSRKGLLTWTSDTEFCRCTSHVNLSYFVLFYWKKLFTILHKLIFANFRFSCYFRKQTGLVEHFTAWNPVKGRILNNQPFCYCFLEERFQESHSTESLRRKYQCTCALMHIWHSLYARVQIKMIPWKFHILNPKNSWVIYPWSLWNVCLQKYRNNRIVKK